MSRRSLKDLKAQLAKTSSENSNRDSSGFYYPFWNLPFDGSVRIRIVEDSDQDNPFVVYKEYYEHTINMGDKKLRIPCPKNNGKNTPCPLCEVSAKLYKAGNKDQGKYYYREAFVLLRGVVIEDGLNYEDGAESSVGKTRPFKLTYQLANKLKAEMGKLDDDETFWDLDEGLDFEIVKSKHQVGEKEYGKYDLSSGFVRRTTSVPDEYREGVTDEPLSALIPEIPSYDEVEELFQKHRRSLNGSDDASDDDDVETQESEDDLMAKLNRNRGAEKAEKPKTATSKKATVVVDEDPPFDLDDDVTVFDSKADDDDDDDIDLTALLGDDD